jgi:AcrR family transcriptional regulator
VKDVRRATTPPASPIQAGPRRAPLSRDRVLRAAMRLADDGGLDAISMRKLGQVLGVEAMSLYKHVANKDDILDGIVDLVTADFEVPSAGEPWKAAIRRSAISARAVLLAHPWASSLIESRSSAGPARLRYLDAIVGALSAAGFPMPTVAQAVMALDSHTYGFVLQELAWPFDAESAPDAASAFADGLPPDAYRNLAAMAELVMTTPGGAVADFTFGLDLLLDGLGRLLQEAGAAELHEPA